MTSSAIISTCGTYRYTLHRSIPSVLRWVKPCLFVMLNPSTADATKDDPTIRRCIGFAKREGCTGMTVVNLFALRATNPAELAMHPDSFGPLNAQYVIGEIEAHRRIGLIVAAWGSNPMAMRVEQVRSLAGHLHAAGALCLGTTKEGHPRHPLYVKADQPLIPWTGATK